MPRTLLQLIQQAAGELGVVAPLSLFGNFGAQEQQFIALAQREGKEFATAANKNGGWQNLHLEYTFNTEVLTRTATTTQGSNIVLLDDTTGLDGGGVWAVASNTLFENRTTILSVDSGTQITLSGPAGDSVTSEPIIFGKIGYSLPPDFDFFIERTAWDNKYRWPLMGPITPQEKQTLHYGVIASGPRSKYYVRKNKFWIDPVPAQSNLMAYDYYTKNWCVSASGTTQSLWAADDDTYLLDEECFILGIKWRWLNAKGLEFEADLALYEAAKTRAISRDGGSRDLPIGGVGYQVNLLNYGNIPDTGYGVSDDWA